MSLNILEGKFCSTRARIRELNRNTSKLKNVLTVPPLSQESMNFIIYKYKESKDGRCKNVNRIANEMYGGVRSAVYRKRNEIVDNIAQWDDVYGNS